MNSIESGAAERREKGEQFRDLVLFTTTLYGEDQTSRVRSHLAEQMMANAKELGVRCVVVDGGSNKEFLDKMKAFENVTVVEDSSLKMGESRRRALQTAVDMTAGAEQPAFFLWTEPEKCDLITADNLRIMVDGLRKGKADVVVPARRDMSSLPKFQAWIEARANKRAKGVAVAGLPPDGEVEILDLWFGPKMFNIEGARYFLDYKGKLDKWDAIIKPVIDAHRGGKKVVSVPVDYIYDRSQKEDEETREFKKKRFLQYTTILAELGDKFWKK